jgi:SAM-dependent methyltransferase
MMELMRLARLRCRLAILQRIKTLPFVSAFRMELETAEFNEEEYLACNPDVAEAVRAGSIASGRAHYLRFGLKERRPMGRAKRPAPLKLPFPEDITPSRRDKILANIDLQVMSGVEIGALDRPLVSRSEGKVFYVDHTATPQLREKYQADPNVSVEHIVDVDAIWGAQTLRDCVGRDKLFDYVVASHVVEHVPDFISWLQEIRSILKPSGSLRLAIPDRRYSFDFLRLESQVHDVLDAFLRRTRTPLPRALIDFHTFARHVDCRAAWAGTLDPAKLQPFATLQDGLQLARDALQNGTYHDTHCWVFTPASFADLCVRLAEVDLMPFACDLFFDTPRGELEFFVSMTPSDDNRAVSESWTRMKDQLGTSGQSKGYRWRRW